MSAPKDGWVLVPPEVANLYNFMCTVFVPMTSQQEEIDKSLQLARAAVDPKTIVGKRGSGPYLCDHFKLDEAES